MEKLLTNDFLANYPDMPHHMNELGSFVFYRTYSRWLPKKGRRETWKEAVARAVEYNVRIGIEQFKRNKYPAPMNAIKTEAETLFDNIFNLRQFLSGRTHWVGGADTKVADKFPLSNFNCSFINITKWSDLSELFYLLLVGTGVGFKSTKIMAMNMPPIRTEFDLIHAEYEPLPKGRRIENTQITVLDNGFVKIYIGDSKEGWVEALKYYFDVLTNREYETIHTIKISYNSIREKGARLHTFGGTASGYEPLRDMFEGIKKVLQGTLDPELSPLEDALIEGAEGKYKRVRPIHILDMGNLIGNNVVVGGVRRTAEIFLCDKDDWECILAKYGINGIWDEVHHQKVCEKLRTVLGFLPTWMEELPLHDANARPLHHRRMSNNSIGFEEKPTREMLNLVYTIMQGEGEPGFVNLEEARRRRPNAEGLNPCAEILLDSYGVCNLTTVNVDAFILPTYPENESSNEYYLDYQGLMQAQALSARAGMRMTCLDLELPHWDDVHKRDRLIGTSLTGWKDAMGKLNYSSEQEKNLLSMLAEVVHIESLKYAITLRIPTPLLDTTVKPEGTLSQVAGGVSSGLHVSHAPYYIRRIRINAHDPLAQVAIKLGWNVSPEVGTEGQTHEEKMRNARTYVIDFPVKSGARRTRGDETVMSQFETYFMFQDVYTKHNSSNTISVRPDEWEEAEQIVWDNWNNFVGVSFLSYSGGNYELAPYEEITEEQYHELKSKMKSFDASVLEKLETDEFDKDSAMEGATSCDSGVCPIF